MLNKIKLTLLPFMALIMFLVPVAFAAVASAEITQPGINGQVCSGTRGGLGGQLTDGCDAEAADKANSLVAKIVNIISIVVGVLAVIMIIIGGLRYITSGGKQESVTAAKHTILYALIGLVIVALAQIIVHFVLGSTNDAVTNG